MPYNEQLADRVLGILGGEPPLRQRRMFGGIAYLLHGNMACGVLPNDRIVRVPQDEYSAALDQPYAREMDYSGRSMRGWVAVGPGASTALALPPK